MCTCIASRGICKALPYVPAHHIALFIHYGVEFIVCDITHLHHLPVSWSFIYSWDIQCYVVNTCVWQHWHAMQVAAA